MGLVVWGQELLQSWGVTPKDDRKPRPETCVFCAKIAARVADPASDDAFVHVDDDLVVFRDWKPAARRHYLVCPRARTSAAPARSPPPTPASRVACSELGARAIARDFPDDPPETRFGFHVPPFNSVDHLHMHAFALPFEPAWKERKYSEEAWARFAFQPAEELVERLEAEGRRDGGRRGRGKRRKRRVYRRRGRGKRRKRRGFIR